MNLETSKKVLKVFGILNIVFGILGIIIGVIAIAGSGAVGVSSAISNTNPSEQLKEGLVVAFVLGLGMLLFSAIDIIEGIFDLRAAKDISKIMPAWVFSIIGLIGMVFSLANFFSNKNFSGSSICGIVISVAISIVTFMAANTIKQAANK